MNQFSERKLFIGMVCKKNDEEVKIYLIRKSASWVEEKRKRRKRKKHNLNAHFDDNSIYRKGRRGRKRTGGSSNRSQERQSSREVGTL